MQRREWLSKCDGAERAAKTQPYVCDLDFTSSCDRCVNSSRLVIDVTSKSIVNRNLRSVFVVSIHAAYLWRVASYQAWHCGFLPHARHTRGRKQVRDCHNLRWSPLSLFCLASFFSHPPLQSHLHSLSYRRHLHSCSVYQDTTSILGTCSGHSQLSHSFPICLPQWPPASKRKMTTSQSCISLSMLISSQTMVSAGSHMEAGSQHLLTHHRNQCIRCQQAQIELVLHHWSECLGSAIARPRPLICVQQVMNAHSKVLKTIKGYSEQKVEKVKEAARKCQVRSCDTCPDVAANTFTATWIHWYDDGSRAAHSTQELLPYPDRQQAVGHHPRWRLRISQCQRGVWRVSL